ncbi:MAG: hypothetical protein EOM84_03565, partial [Sphingobacteriia bacterium]|nr:hypothetical protein [Sphingobacteriia bacterium]
MKIKIISIIGGLAILAGVVFAVAQKGEIVTVERLNQSGKEFEEIEIKNETALRKESISEEEIEKEEVLKPEEIDKSSDDTPKEEGFISEEETKDEKIEEELKIINKGVDWGFASGKDRKIDTIILHTSYNILGGDEYSA